MWLTYNSFAPPRLAQQGAMLRVMVRQLFSLSPSSPPVRRCSDVLFTPFNVVPPHFGLPFLCPYTQS